MKIYAKIFWFMKCFDIWHNTLIGPKPLWILDSIKQVNILEFKMELDI